MNRYRLNPNLDISKKDPKESRRLAYSVLLAGVLGPRFLSIILYEQGILYYAVSGNALSVFAYAAFAACAWVAVRMLLLRPTPIWVVSACLASSSLVQIFTAHIWLLSIGLPSFLFSLACMIERDEPGETSGES